MATLSDTGCTGVPRLTVVGSSCGSTWVSLDSFNGSADLAQGDALIDKFYKRGRQVKVDLLANLSASTAVASFVKRVDGVPPKSAVLANVPWLELEGASKAALVAYAGTSPSDTFPASWAGNAAVSPKDITFCLGGDCSAPADHEDIDGRRNGSTSKALTLSAFPANAAAFKQISLYGRNREQMGVETNFVSCGGPSVVSCN